MNKLLNYFLIIFFFSAFVSCKQKRHEVIAENEFYTCSMDPQVMEKQMGLCPICKMPLTKVVIDKTQLHLIHLSDEQIKLGNIKTDTVKRGEIWEEKTLTGVFAVDQSSQEQISSRFNGRIDKLYFKIAGQEIKKGDLIYEVYSRDLMQAEEEFLFALEKSQAFTMSSTSLIELAKNKLLLMGLTDDQVNELQSNKEAKIVNPIYSKAGGTVIEIAYKEGDYINEGSTIFKLADLTSLWVETQVYSNEMNLMDEETQLEVIPDAFPDEIMSGKIDFSNPELQPGTKINLVRIKVDNKSKKLMPGMMAFVNVKSKAVEDIVLPIASVIQSGKRSIVWIQNKDGSFEAKEVKTGIQTKDAIQINAGIEEGTVIVVSGAYLIYSDYVFKRGAYPLTEAMAGNKHVH